SYSFFRVHICGSLRAGFRSSISGDQSTYERMQLLAMVHHCLHRFWGIACSSYSHHALGINLKIYETNFKEPYCNGGVNVVSSKGQFLSGIRTQKLAAD